MNGYEKIIKIIKSIIKDNQNTGIELGIYKDGGIETSDLFIPITMVYKLDFLNKKRVVKVKGNVEEGGGEGTHTHGWIDTSEYIDELKNGDLIAYQKINDTKFLVIGRVI